ncbi:DNA polymerase delta subunit Cdm1 [Schizosaccharomyces japonicus yFS275]|uniref:DNA polymerase delta subunit Cdm1 n=1 Tax=Schizosaccharomyces japonicus (strain yFS275 / FY16936) TaxID=402676 RepID=B6JW39_SCHJY|nr:DNA polymerase delta subunit Cdm1 [Schizosaccharomyces japonicus yFS275]EEB05590.1 DNA polymerase delta subunit Cdm1 [Schizosaccharomyces japonicus yFS275]
MRRRENIQDQFPRVVRSGGQKPKPFRDKQQKNTEKKEQLTLEERVSQLPELQRKVNEEWESSVNHNPPVHAEGMSKVELVLHKFDMTAKYGPYLGMTRLERWHRAERYGLHPPDFIRHILELPEAYEANNVRKSLFYSVASTK